MKRFLKRVLQFIGILLVSPLILMILYRWIPPTTTAFMVRHAVVYQEFYRYDWESSENISKWVGKAMVASEDQKFYDHFGFDVEAVQKALKDRERGRRVRGASTISQQVVKNLFLWPGQSWFRKGLEAGYTLWLELVLPKERILEIYVNIAEFGYGVYGAEAAAQRYFDKSASKLTRSESALMAVVLPNPKKMKIDRPGPYMRGRQAWVLRQM
ncbi:MAG: peptidoglycan transglycosylase [Bacteroidota bacterium]